MEFIFMLTHDDQTVSNAEMVLAQVGSTGLRYIGFKDVGTTSDQRRRLVSRAHDLGLEVMIELVAPDPATEVASLKSAVAAGADWILGGTQVDEGRRLIGGTSIKYCPFPGIVEGHPSVLRGEEEFIAEQAKEFVEFEEVFGVDLLAYRHPHSDPIELTTLVADRCRPAPVIVAGSICTERQVRSVEETGAWGFTIGSAIFDGCFGKGSITEAVQKVLACAS